MRKFLPLFLLLGLAVIADAHGISEADRQAIVDGGNLRYLWLGAIHMVTGYDHLLFLFGVIFFLTGVKDIFKFVTAFTIGHSITLILATFMKITANYYLIDAVIALSVCYKAFDNLDGFRKYLKVGRPHLLAMILLFGLIHGFGLSTRLQQLPLPEEGLLTRILSFNVGVELGQVAALSVLVLLLAGWRRTQSFRRLGGIANILLLAAGIGLFIYQLNGYFRGEEDHHEESHAPDEAGHSHDKAGSHSHGDEEHSHGDAGHGEAGIDTGAGRGAGETHDHGDAAHTHGVKNYGSPSETGGSDSAGSNLESMDPGTVQEHSHEEGHSHSHDEDQVPPAKRPQPVKPKPHSHGEGVPHEH
jgi:hypothetical protein